MLSMRILSIAPIVVILAIASLRAQPPAAPAAKPDTAAVVQRIAALKAAAGAPWADTVRFWCEAPRANRADDPVIEPVRIFDNVYAIGSIGTVAYVIQTSAGLIMIDALSPNELESRLLPGFARLGLDPAQVKIILVAHGHADHFGGAGYFQQRFGSRVYVSPPDWDLMEAPARGRGPAPVQPRRQSATPIWRKGAQSRSATSPYAPSPFRGTRRGRWVSSFLSWIAARSTSPRFWRLVAHAGASERRCDGDVYRFSGAIQGGHSRRQALTRGCRIIR